MITTEEQVRLASRMYDARKTMRRIAGDDYGPTVKAWMNAIGLVAIGRQVEILDAFIEMADAVRVGGQEFGVLWLLAATVELIEPDELTPALEEEAA